jgi:anti-anti-sigma factor
VSSRAVGVLLAHYQGLLREGGTMRLCRVNPQVLPVLEQMRVHMLIDMYPTIQEAVQTEWE